MVRQLVTGHRDGKSVVISHGTPARSHVYEHTHGMESCLAWSTSARPRLSATNRPESTTENSPVIPPLGGTSLVFLTLPPDAWAVDHPRDHGAAIAEMFEQQPDMAATFEPDAPGFHRTDSIDYVVVLEGTVHLALDEGEVELGPHDVVVQGGTRHAWRNKSDKVVRLAVVLIGAERDVS